MYGYSKILQNNQSSTKWKDTSSLESEIVENMSSYSCDSKVNNSESQVTLMLSKTAANIDTVLERANNYETVPIIYKNSNSHLFLCIQSNCVV